MAKIHTRPWDAAEHLETDEDMAAYLEAALEEGDPALVAAALGDIARAKGMAQIARETGLGRESLYKACRRKATRSLPPCSRLSGRLAYGCEPPRRTPRFSAATHRKIRKAGCASLSRPAA